MNTTAIGISIALAGIGAAPVLGQAPDYSRNCAAGACHGPLAEGKHVHNPVTQGACEICHEVDDEDEHTFNLVEEGNELCVQCHDAFEGEHVHEPIASGSCMWCHDPHKGEGPGLLLTATPAQTCAECHDNVLEELKFQHGPAATGACVACHDAHASDVSGLLTAEGTALCTACHQPMAQRLEQADTVHLPVEDDCVSCHDAHGGDNRFFLAGDMPDLCLDCHDDIGELATDAPVGHDAVTQGRACASCHDAHASTADALLLGESMTLCLSCHAEPVKSGDVTLAAMGPLLRENPHHHGPIQDEDCGSCHVAHGGEHARLLTETFPPGFYAPFDEATYTLCFDCHDSDLALEAESESATAFRNGARNLHYVHVNRDVKGRSCRACHSVHASDNPKHIAFTVRFGSWDLPINYEPSPTGGTCLPGCHKRYDYDRDQPVQNIKP